MLQAGAQVMVTASCKNYAIMEFYNRLVFLTFCCKLLFYSWNSGTRRHPEHEKTPDVSNQRTVSDTNYDWVDICIYIYTYIKNIGLDRSSTSSRSSANTVNSTWQPEPTPPPGLPAGGWHTNNQELTTESNKLNTSSHALIDLMPTWL